MTRADFLEELRFLSRTDLLEMVTTSNVSIIDKPLSISRSRLKKKKVYNGNKDTLERNMDNSRTFDLVESVARGVDPAQAVSEFIEESILFEDDDVEVEDGSEGAGENPSSPLMGKEDDDLDVEANSYGDAIPHQPGQQEGPSSPPEGIGGPIDTATPTEDLGTADPDVMGSVNTAGGAVAAADTAKDDDEFMESDFTVAARHYVRSHVQTLREEFDEVDADDAFMLNDLGDDDPLGHDAEETEDELDDLPEPAGVVSDSEEFERRPQMLERRMIKNRLDESHTQNQYQLGDRVRMRESGRSGTIVSQQPGSLGFDFHYLVNFGEESMNVKHAELDKVS